MPEKIHLNHIRFFRLSLGLTLEEMAALIMQYSPKFQYPHTLLWNFERDFREEGMSPARRLDMYDVFLRIELDRDMKILPLVFRPEWLQDKVTL